MRIITNSELPSAMQDVHPTHISVAYVGIDWRTYIDEKNLKEIIISPTIGSNPVAITQLVVLLGWSNVHFLDALHAKFYIGESKAAVGSFNLSKNGISVNGLEELGVITEDPIHIDRLNSEFSRLRSMAINQYPNPEDKEGRLKALRTMRNQAIAEGILSDENPLVQIEDYMPLANVDIWIMWWRNVEVERNYKVLAAADINLREESFGGIVSNWTTALESDNIEPGSWLLMWLARGNGMPNLNAKPYWFYVHEAIPNAVEDESYTKMLLQRKDKNIPTVPFDLDRKEVAAALKSKLSTDEFSAFRENDGAPWSTQSCALNTKRLIAAIQSACRKDA